MKNSMCPGRISVFFSGLPLWNRLVILLTPIIVITFISVGLFSYNRTVSIVLDQKLNMLENLNEKVETSVSDLMRRAIETSETILYFEPVFDSVLGTKRVSLADQMEDFRASERYIDLLERQFQFSSIRVYTQNTDLLYQNQGVHFFPYSRLEQEIPVVPKVQYRQDQLIIVDTYSRMESAWLSVNRLAVVRLLVNGPNKTITAAIVIEVDPNILIPDWEFDFVSDYNIAIVNSSGKILCASESERVGGEISEEMRAALFSEDVFELDGRYFVTHPIPRYDWMLYMDVPVSYIYEDTFSILTTTMVLILIACAFVGVALFLTAYTVTRKLQGLIQMIRADIHQESIQGMIRGRVAGRVDSRDEADLLLQEYNRLLERIRLLTIENEQAIRGESEARFMALQLQINPHFLYNALASIKSYIEMNERAAAGQLLMRLSDLFNHTLGRGSHYIPLREEINTIETYLQIQQMVYYEEFQYKIDVPKSIESIIIPKFLLQPIVENALMHGAREAAEGGWIHLYGENKDRKVWITVEDNGPGFKQAFLDHNRPKDRREGRGIGLQNVCLRLKMYFGDDADIRFENLPGGARVVIQIPLPITQTITTAKV